MRIAIATTGRFHVLDLARELVRLGHSVSFYSHVPRFRARGFEAHEMDYRNLLGYVWPLVAVKRWGSLGARRWIDPLLLRIVDRLVARLLAPCDAFVGMSGLCFLSAKRARELQATVYLERGSVHILAQKEILSSVSSGTRPSIPKFYVDRELWGYQFSDVISIPSRNVERTFLERGMPAGKLFRNPYGVDLASFQPTLKPLTKIPTLVFAGTWSMRKGCDILATAVNHQPWELIHVGGIGDVQLPNMRNLVSVGFVPQNRLHEVYAKADVFVQPSREEGLSLVQAQALACGLPLVCTDRTGGEDLGDMLNDPSWVTVVPSNNPGALRSGIFQGLLKSSSQSGMRDILGTRRTRFSWQAYAERYSARLSSANTK